MCIAQPVGKNSKNHDDVKTVQVLLNLNLYRLLPLNLLVEDGTIGPATIAAITEFQRRVVKMQEPDGRVDPGGNTLKLLRDGIPAGFSRGILQGTMIHATARNVDKYCDLLSTKMSVYQINTPLRIAHFLAQLGEESGELRYSQEIASGNAYEGRDDLGNTEAGDGPRFKGRGLIQLTGRANYANYGTSTGRDYTSGSNYQLLASDPATAVDVACWFWNENDINTAADSDDVVAVTIIVNGGTGHLANRKRILARAKFFLKC